MQPLTKVMQGATCTVKWALGLPETVEKLRELKIEQGSKLQVVCKSSDYMIIGVGSKRYRQEMAQKVLDDDKSINQ